MNCPTFSFFIFFPKQKLAFYMTISPEEVRLVDVVSRLVVFRDNVGEQEGRTCVFSDVEMQWVARSHTTKSSWAGIPLSLRV